MPELPIYPDRVRESPGYALERRVAAFRDAPPGRRDEASLRMRIECAFETLRLTGAGVDRTVVARVAREGRGDSLLLGQFEALERIEAEARGSETPGVDSVREVHRMANPPSSGELRTEEAKPQFQNARPSPPRFVAARLEDLLGWLSADSGRSMFPAERMALWFPRFLEIAPFDHGNFRTAHLFLSFFSCAVGFPPVTLRLEDADDIRDDVERALRFDTFPLVRRFSEALGRSLDLVESLRDDA
jgi:hypothetical protein